MKQNKTKN